MGRARGRGRVIFDNERRSQEPHQYILCSEVLSENSRKRRGDILKILPKLLRVSGGCLGLRRRRRTWGSCEKPRGAANQALIRGYPNGATRRGSYLVIPI